MALIPPKYEAAIQKAAQQLHIPVAVMASIVQVGTHWDGDVEGWIDRFIPNFEGLLQESGDNIYLALARFGGPEGSTQAENYATKIVQMSQLAPTQYQIMDNNGISPFNSNVSGFLSDNQPMLSMGSLQSEYPLIAALISSDPTLTKLFQDAIVQQQSVDGFVAALQNSSWWATHSDTARQLIALMKTDPATYQQNVNNLFANIQMMASQLGATLTQSQLHQFAVDALFGGYDQNQAMLNEKFAQFVKPVSGNHFGGQAGTYEDQIRQAMRDMGVFIPEGQLDTQIKQIVGGQSSVQSVLAQLRTQAASMYPAYTSQINSGMNVSDIASPYIGRAQQLLEMGPGAMNIQTPMIKQALQYVGPDGKPTAMPMYDFENAVRKDPRWMQTDNAQDAFMSNAHRVLQDFGFAY